MNATLPIRLYDWRHSPDGTSFAYGGDEVDLSVWDTERAFQAPAESTTASNSGSKKRKRNDDLFPAEVWRARNVSSYTLLQPLTSKKQELSNDHLGLRQPVRITALTYLNVLSSGHDLAVGTQFGDLRRYDTKSGRRPVSNWKGLGKVGGLKAVEKGFAEQ